MENDTAGVLLPGGCGQFSQPHVRQIHRQIAWLRVCGVSSPAEATKAVEMFHGKEFQGRALDGEYRPSPRRASALVPAADIAKTAASVANADNFSFSGPETSFLRPAFSFLLTINLGPSARGYCLFGPAEPERDRRNDAVHRALRRQLALHQEYLGTRQGCCERMGCLNTIHDLADRLECWAFTRASVRWGRKARVSAPSLHPALRVNPC